MGRDLLYKPSVPVPLGEEEGSSTKKGKAKATAKPGVGGARELGRVGEDGPRVSPGQSAHQARLAGQPAFKAAYFNKDTSGVGAVNLRSSGAAALRGSEGVTDLRKVVLPTSAVVSNPDPVQLRGASDLMGIDGSFEPSLEGFLGRQSAWAKGEGSSVELIEERQRQLEQMVEARKAALERMTQRKGQAQPRSVSVQQALEADGKALEQIDDVVEAGANLVRRTAAAAEGMHRRLAKMLGIKR